MNWNMIGHEWAVDLLREHVARQKMRHAYLLTGPRGVGRRTLGLRFTQAINCTASKKAGDPCGQCRACQQIEKMIHPDLDVVQAEQEGGILKVDQIRELQRHLALTPFEARYRVALLLRFEEAHASAANALLKTLEEPPPQVILVVTAESPEVLLPTIVSRCEVLRLRPLPLNLIEKGIQKKWSCPEQQARFLAHLSGGRPGIAYQYFSQPELLEEHQSRLEELHRMLLSNRVERFTFADVQSKDKEALRNLLLSWLSFWRDCLLQASSSTAPIANLDRAGEIAWLAEAIGIADTYQQITNTETAIQQLSRNVNPRLLCENYLLGLPYLKSLPSSAKST